MRKKKKPIYLKNLKDKKNRQIADFFDNRRNRTIERMQKLPNVSYFIVDNEGSGYAYDSFNNRIKRKDVPKWFNYDNISSEYELFIMNSGQQKEQEMLTFFEDNIWQVIFEQAQYMADKFPDRTLKHWLEFEVGEAIITWNFNMKKIKSRMEHYDWEE